MIEADGSVRVEHETHRLGLFSRQHWLPALAGAGFEATSFTEETTEDRTPREVFVGRRPPGERLVGDCQREFGGRTEEVLRCGADPGP